MGVDLQASPRQVPAVAGSALLLQASPVDNLRVVSSVVMVFGPCMLWGPCLSAYRYQVFPLKPSHLTKLARLVSERSIYGTFSMGGGVTTPDGLSSCLGCHEPYLSAWPPAQVPSTSPTWETKMDFWFVASAWLSPCCWGIWGNELRDGRSLFMLSCCLPNIK